ncbi:MAG: DNA alkylation repair protein, partial [Actinobacteria bacterium]|nr:DNA alkylation repair protein [Actinomycetota bacterium]
QDLVKAVRAALVPLANPAVAKGAHAYMKGIAPFLGLPTPIRRKAVIEVFKTFPQPTSIQLGSSATALFAQVEREFAYSACDFLQRNIGIADEDFLRRYVEKLVVTKSWWDTVDSLGSAAVSPLTMHYPSRSLMNEWIRSENIWLNRAAIQHQRGRKGDTDVDYVMSLCARHSHSREFFITKAVGWALRDIAAFNKPAVRAYLKQFPELNSVAVREAQRGLNR